MISKIQDDPRYPLPDVSGPLESPSYSTVLDWMKITKGRHVSFDFWARGNYTRRLLLNRANNVTPLLVRVKNLAELRWAYKRLVLLDLPVDFIYAGNCKKGKVLHLCPSDILFDAGWGYIGALGSETNISGRPFFPIIGHAKLMPEAILDWLVNEAAEEFLAGNLFVAPAELIGLDSKAPPSEMAKHSDLSGGIPVVETFSDAKALMELNIPYIDKLSPSNFRKLISDYADHLVSFRKAFHEFVIAREQSEENGKQALLKLRFEIDELTKSDKNILFRQIISSLGGVFCLTASVAGALSGELLAGLAASGSVLNAIKNAADVHQYLRDKTRDKNHKINASPYAMFWKLGMTKPSNFKPARQVLLGDAPKQSSSDFNENSDFHWLCPPTNGMGFLAFEEVISNP